MEADFVANNVKTSLKNVQQNGRKLYLVTDEITANENAIVDTIYSLAAIQELYSERATPDRLQEMRHLNGVIRTLAETHANLMRLQLVIKNGVDY